MLRIKLRKCLKKFEKIHVASFDLYEFLFINSHHIQVFDTTRNKFLYDKTFRPNYKNFPTSLFQCKTPYEEGFEPQEKMRV